MDDVIKKILGKQKHKSMDSDGDGVMDFMDCKPFDPKKQGVIHKLGAAIARKAGKEEAAERIEARGEKIDKERKEVREERSGFKERERESFRKERLVVAEQRGKERARRPSGIAGLISGLQAKQQTTKRIIRRKPKRRMATPRRRRTSTRRRRAAPRRRRAAPRRRRASPQPQPKQPGILDFKF